MKKKLLKLPGVELLNRQQLKKIGGTGYGTISIDDDRDGGGMCPNDKCQGNWDCGGVNKYCLRWYCDSGESFKQCSPPYI